MNKTDKKPSTKRRWTDLFLVALISASVGAWGVYNYKSKATSATTEIKKVEEDKKSKNVLFNIRISKTYASLDDEIRNCQGPSSEYAELLATPEFSLKFNYIFLSPRAPGQLADPGKYGLMNNTSVYRYYRSQNSTVNPIFTAKMDNIQGEDPISGEFQIITLKNSEIKNINDLEGKIIQVPDLSRNAAGVLGYFFATQPIKYKSNETYVSVKEGLAALKEKKIDALIVFKDDLDMKFALRGKLSDDEELQVLFTSDYRFPMAFIYGSNEASEEETLRFKKYLKGIFSDPEKLKAFTYCTQVLGIEDLSKDAWKNTFEKFEVAAKYLSANVKALKER